MTSESSLNTQIDQLREKGFVVIPRFVADDGLGELNAAARMQLRDRVPPIEFEADLRYPGAPPSRAAAGGETVRRLLDAYARDLSSPRAPPRRDCANGCKPTSAKRR